MVGIFLFLVGHMPSHNVDTIDLFPQENYESSLRIFAPREQVFEKQQVDCYPFRDTC